MTRTPEPAGVAAADAQLLASVVAVSTAQPLSVSPRARVYRVTDTAGESWVVKLVHPERMAQAVQLSARLSGARGAGEIVLSGEVGGVGYLLYRDHPTDLATALAAGPIPPQALHAILAPVAELLDRLHAAGYVHADVKPENVLVSAAGDGVLADLDECLPVGASAERVTPIFCAPELLEGRAATAAVDVFGFAMTVAAALLGAVRRPDGDWPDGVPGAVREAITRDLTADPDQRCVSPTALVAVLLRADERSPVLEQLPATAARSAPRSFADLPDPVRELQVAAGRAFGNVGARTPTVDRLGLRLHPDLPPVAEQAEAERPLWRRPAMIVALGVAVVATVLAVVLLVV